MTVQRALIGIGLICLLLGLAWPWIAKLGVFRLPGDVVIERENFRFYFPVTTMIIISVVISVILWLMRK